MLSTTPRTRSRATTELAPATIAPRATGVGCRIAVVDSGINFDHPHLSLPPKGVCVSARHGVVAVQPRDFFDRHGHGTCCAALVHLLAPDAELVAVRVADQDGLTDVVRLAAGLEAALSLGARIICAPLGCRADDDGRIGRASRAIAEVGGALVAADPGGSVWPARSPGVLAVGHLDGVDVARVGGALVAEGRPRPAGGSPVNFWGPSLAAARGAAALARFAELSGLEGALLLEGFSKALDVR